MRISDWSSDVCSSDLIVVAAAKHLIDPFADRKEPHVVRLILVGRRPHCRAAQIELRHQPAALTLRRVDGLGSCRFAEHITPSGGLDANRAADLAAAQPSAYE